MFPASDNHEKAVKPRTQANDSAKRKLQKGTSQANADMSKISASPRESSARSRNAAPTVNTPADNAAAPVQYGVVQKAVKDHAAITTKSNVCETDRDFKSCQTSGAEPATKTKSTRNVGLAKVDSPDLGIVLYDKWNGNRRMQRKIKQPR